MLTKISMTRTCVAALILFTGLATAGAQQRPFRRIPPPPPVQQHTAPQQHAATVQAAPPAARPAVEAEPRSFASHPAEPAFGQQSAAQEADHPPVQQRAGAPATQLVVPNRPGQSQQHLAGWMEAHRNMPLAEQQRALENEPGFHSLNPQEQQRMHQRLMQLHNLPPQQQAAILSHTEQMERLVPAQRQQVRGAMAQLGSLPEDRRHVVSRTFYQLRDMPPAQRQAYMNSAPFRSQYNEQERGAINGLLNITPFWTFQSQPQR